jgi:hypothetical protein
LAVHAFFFCDTALLMLQTVWDIRTVRV